VFGSNLERLLSGELSLNGLIEIVDDLAFQVLVLLNGLLNIAQNFENVRGPTRRRGLTLIALMEAVLFALRVAGDGGHDRGQAHH